jgi:hypothetical protein
VPILLKNSIFFEVAGIRLKWPAGISQISGVPGLDGVINIFLLLVE